MILDDEEVLLHVLTTFLKANYPNIFSTSDEDEFLKNLSSFAPDIIILDLMLKKIDGLELITEIKKFNKNIQIITISGQEDTKLITKALARGATTFVSKPFKLDFFDSVLEDVWNREAEKRAAEKQRIESEKRFYTLANATPAAVFTVDKNYRYNFINDSFTRITGYTREELQGLYFWDVVHPNHSKAVEKAGKEMLNNPGSKTMNNEFMFVNKNGESLWADFSAEYLDQDGEPTLIGSVFDITKRKKAEKHARYVSNHDPLTGLYNRKSFLANIAEKTKNDPASFFVIANINIDRFSNINSLGEKIGDEVLKVVASRLRKFLGPDIVIARGSSDDFFALYKLSKEKNINFLKNDLQKKILEGVFDNSEEIYPSKISASIGLCTNIDGNEPAELIKNSQMARRRARREGGNCIKYFEPIDAESIQHQDMELELQNALPRGEIFLMYQQQVDTAGNHIGMEVLVRWNSKKYGLISPTVFIPLAVSSGLIEELGLWILREALRKGQEWLTAGYDPGVISVNVSPGQLRTEDIVKQIKQYTKKIGFPTEKLKLEITETELTDDNLKTQKIIESLQKMGIKVAIDDFGIGGSNLDRLVSIKFDTLKIDKSLIDNIFLNKNAMNMVKFVIEMGHLLGAKIVAEGVENNEQFELLKQLGCDEFQGYYFSKPLFPEDIEDKFSRSEVIN